MSPALTKNEYGVMIGKKRRKKKKKKKEEEKEEKEEKEETQPRAELEASTRRKRY